MSWKTILSIMLALVVYLLVGGLVFWRLESSRPAAASTPVISRAHVPGDAEIEGEATTVDRPTAALSSSLPLNPPLSPPDVIAALLAELRIELPGEIDRRIMTQDKKQNGTPTTAAFSREICLTKDVVVSIVGEWSRLRQAREDEQNMRMWNLTGSIFFATTVITTIGYGNLVPRTTAGRAFFCVYAIFGIPLCLVALLIIGDRLNAVGLWLETRLVDRSGVCGRVRLGHHGRSAAFAVVGSVVFLLVPAAIFSRLQSWDYGTALYFAVVTLSTVGFGDYVAGITYSGPLSPLYRLLVGVWIFCGLAWLACVISCIRDCLHSLATNVEHHFPLIGPCVGEGCCVRSRDRCLCKVDRKSEERTSQPPNDIGISSSSFTVVENHEVCVKELGASDKKQ